MKRGKALKIEVLKTLEVTPLSRLYEALSRFPLEKVVSHLIGAFCHRNEEVKWKAVLGFGWVVSKIAEKDLEKARVIIRRLMWMLNEESGGMAWGVPEGFAEALYNSEPLKEEYISIFISYLWDTESEGKYKSDNYLEFPPAQRGVIWGIGRLAQKYEDDVRKNHGHLHLKKHLSSSDEVVSLLSLWAIFQFKKKDFLEESLGVLSSLKSLSELKNPCYTLYTGTDIEKICLRDLLSLFQN